MKNLNDVANELQIVINNLSQKTDIKQLTQDLKDILIDIYSVINKNEKDRIINAKILGEKDNLNKSGHGEIINLDKGDIKTTIIKIGSTKNIPTIIEDEKGNKIYKFKGGEEYIHGKGIYYLTKEKGDKYIGDFRNNIVEGKGVSEYSNGDRYEGDFHNWNKHGKGTYEYNNGHKYIGDFFDDKAEGIGTYYYKNGDSIKGEFKDSKPNGRVIKYYKSEPRAGDRYEGIMKNFYLNGRGLYFYKNGDIYDGEFKLDKKQGKGIMYYANGDREMGNYKDDKKIGKHVKLTANGKVITNEYK